MGEGGGGGVEERRGGAVGRVQLSRLVGPRALPSPRILPSYSQVAAAGHLHWWWGNLLSRVASCCQKG